MIRAATAIFRFFEQTRLRIFAFFGLTCLFTEFGMPAAADKSNPTQLETLAFFAFMFVALYLWGTMVALGSRIRFLPSGGMTTAVQLAKQSDD